MTPSTPPSANDVRAWLHTAVDREASDLHVVPGYPPVLRVHGELHPLELPPLEPEAVRTMLAELAPPHAMGQFQADHNTDFALELPRGDRAQRFRVNYFMTGEQAGACFRVIPAAIPDFAWAGFHDELAARLTHFRNGLVLICGVVGSGKTTTLAMLVQLLNRQGGHRIITVEEPVEYLFPRLSGSLVTQREVGQDVHTFADGLKYALRQDPDVILVGEIRDRDTAQMALSAAETGHMVFSTLHTRDAKGAITRFTDLFPQGDQREVRAQLSLSLRAIVSQHLLPSAFAGQRRVLALEILFNSLAIAAAIRTAKIESVDNVIVTSRADGMITLDESIKRLLKDQRITRETAERFASATARL
jgi:twitching motility protein PilT